MARPCLELVAQLNVIKNDHTELHQQIEAVSNSEVMDTSAKILLLRGIYEKRKTIVGITDEISREIKVERLLNRNADELDTDEIKCIRDYLSLMTHEQKPLNKKELAFLYRTDSAIKNLRHIDIKVMNIIAFFRNVKADLTLVTGIAPEEITTTLEEFMLYGHQAPKLHFGDLALPKMFGDSDMKFPEKLIGDLDLRSLNSARGIVFPKVIHGTLNLPGLKSVEHLKLPEEISGNLKLNSIKSADGLIFPQEIGGSLFFVSLITSDGLKLPNAIGKDLLLTGLSSLEGLVLPDFVGGTVYLNGEYPKGQIKKIKIKYPNHKFGFMNYKNITKS